MKIVKNELEGMFAAPDHPITCLNPAPWEIIEVRLEVNPFKVWIRGEGSMWFRADQCYIHEKEEVQLYVNMHNE